ncbi:disease resistance protein RUN1-like [Eucalyptus grandis]|uniref:disease resistance protein RUN1-like n=1 Tax=Eucalyptus grandis TaxID=71139 RepID=UPI00192EDC0B|nr:disease resistance protein RUN1-like [Eucalyptus grandis]XP_039173186.1 disease resistance protein RUN1-like [Eucalyptus grandis]XP_039173187.1 disease resistance protein RUN1-like [Eucalyptus grandis]XP_039173188.1 disease resistance protein RUN1-like [Eucalyptus grandis]XP_039173189.1 disease resistance protein RUN1-like [Eucalyptus grandis]XP_039173190.1 disease resistance protein RUN1-like [Eucalyptus grandis]XP_039173191.1 disease resistance protein RUN1-like [Eucalyptus grandis]XP_0
MDKEQRKRKRPEEESTRGASSSSSISPEATGLRSGQYDVFLNFRGSDTRKTFTDHLYRNLVKAGTVPFCVFRDENSIPIGEEFGSEILDAIVRSKISIPVISENYASSKWCLRELVHIMECKKSMQHIVLPIFYKVAPSDVRRLKGNFGNAFHLRRERYDEKDIQEWQQALNEVSYLHGWESDKFEDGHEGELIEHVVGTVLSKLQEDFQLNVPKQLVGLDDCLKNIMNWIDSPSFSARMIGIYGMGGIGKTTLAKIIHNQLSNKFVHVSFLPDVRESTKRHGITYLQSQLISDILQSKNEVSRIDDGINIIKSRFKGKKVLILLDDIDDKNQLDALAGERNWFMVGSLIIVTTRNEAILDQSEFEVDYKYELNGLDKVHALLLFNRHAFPMDHSPKDFDGISRDIISTMGGLPLALKVVGSYLYKKKE